MANSLEAQFITLQLQDTLGRARSVARDACTNVNGMFQNDEVTVSRARTICNQAAASGIALVNLVIAADGDTTSTGPSGVFGRRQLFVDGLGAIGLTRAMVSAETTPLINALNTLATASKTTQQEITNACTAFLSAVPAYRTI